MSRGFKCECGSAWPFATLSSVMRRACYSSRWPQNEETCGTDLDPTHGLEPSSDDPS